MLKERLITNYFAFLAKTFPVMSGSARFPFMPYVDLDEDSLERLENFSARSIRSVLSKLESFRSKFEEAQKNVDLVEDRARVELLLQSCNDIITEFSLTRSWERSPGLYLKIAFIGLEQTVEHPSLTERLLIKRVLKRLKKVPTLLGQVQQNVEAVTPRERGIAQTLIRDGVRQLAALPAILKADAKIVKAINVCQTALRELDKYVSAIPVMDEPEGLSFSVVLNDIFGIRHTAEELFFIAEEEWTYHFKKLEIIAKDLGMPWREVCQNFQAISPDENVLDGIVRIVHQLRIGMEQADFPTFMLDGALRISPVPTHLASAANPLFYEPGSRGQCFVNEHAFIGRGFRDNVQKLEGVRREAVFLAARSSYPGNHPLHSIRLQQSDAVLRQCIRPLFRSGWLAYAEELFAEVGIFGDDTKQNQVLRVVQHYRGMHRAARAMIASGLAAESLDLEHCITLLETVGYSRENSLDKVRSIRRNSGIHVPSVLSVHTIRGIRNHSLLEQGEFCKALLQNSHLSLNALPDAMRLTSS